MAATDGQEPEDRNAEIQPGDGDKPERKRLDFNVAEPKSMAPFIILVLLSLVVLAALVTIWLMVSGRN